MSAGCVCVCMWVSVVLAVEIVRTAAALIWMCIQSEIMACLQGSRASWKVLECFDKISRNWKIILVRKFKLKFLEFAGTWMQGCGRNNIHVCTPLVFVIRSYSDKTFYCTTCDSDEHCSMDATVTLFVFVFTYCCRTMTGSWKILSGSWKSHGIHLGKTVGTLCLMRLIIQELFVSSVMSLPVSQHCETKNV